MTNQISFDSLRNFFHASRGGSQEQIILEFLEAVVLADPLIDSGSVLITDSPKNRLVLFNENEVLFRKRILDAAPAAQWPKEVPFFGSTAGLACRTGASQSYVRTQGLVNDFFGKSPIENMICIPIVTGARRPFGVVCFHNNVVEKRLDPIKAQLEAYVEVLSLALHVPHPELQIDNNIFIVHGRDEASRQALELLLIRNGAKPKVLANEDKNAQTIIDALDDLVRTCKAGFILLTPDDEGRLFGEEPFSRRARENVIFETGLLFSRFREFGRVCLLLKKPTTLPSDLSGISYEEFEHVNDLEARITRRLTDWGIRTPRD